MHGAEDTAEHAAAITLRDLIAAAWPLVAEQPTHDVRIVAGAKCHGQTVRDIDLLLLASFGPGVEFQPFFPFTTRSGASKLPDKIVVRSLCVVFEVKDHPPEAVRFIGTSVQVRYRERWHDASAQNDKQIYAVKRYLEINGLHSPRITGLVWLRNVALTTLPIRPHNILASPLTWELVLNVIAQLSPPKEVNGVWTLDATGLDHGGISRAADLFTKTLTPTRLDRLRMERVNRRTADLAPIRLEVGNRLTILRGRGGTGKTMRLLQLAHVLTEEEDSRVLMLTYNRALVADIRRLLTIMGIQQGFEGCTIQIQTVHSFLYAALRGLGFVPEPGSDFLDAYERLKDEALAFLQAGAISPGDLDNLVASDVESFHWDYVFVDEVQDWPENERNLLLSFFSPSRVVVADGIDQLVRSSQPADWRGNIKQNHIRVVPLRTSLRMKAGLARFVSTVARHLGLLYSEWESNAELPGGRIIVVDGSYFADRSLHERLLQANADDRNEPIDMLFCVPPSHVNRLPTGEARSVAASVFEAWGYRTWDGASEKIRDGYPTEVDQLRIVQYESCRGLEGWIGVNLALDRFYDLKLASTSDLADEDSMIASSTSQRLDAARWLTIPLTRAMDTLVIQFDLPSSPVRTAVQAAAVECADYVEWITMR